MILSWSTPISKERESYKQFILIKSNYKYVLFTEPYCVSSIMCNLSESFTHIISSIRQCSLYGDYSLPVWKTNRFQGRAYDSRDLLLHG